MNFVCLLSLLINYIFRNKRSSVKKKKKKIAPIGCDSLIFILFLFFKHKRNRMQIIIVQTACYVGFY